MTNSIKFLNQQWLLAVVLIGLFLFGLFFWKEFKKPYKKYLVINVIIGLIALLSLSLIALKPAVSSKHKALKMVILTDGYKPMSIDSLKKENLAQQVVVYKKGKELFANNVKPTSVIVLGQGIAHYDLWQLDGIPTQYISGTSIPGIIKLKYNTQVSIGQAFSVKGIYNNPKKGNRLVLEDTSGISLDSVLFNNELEQKFNLTAIPKINGKFIYSLVEKDSLSNMVNTEPLPIDVHYKSKLKILILNSFPTFETKYLKNFLAENGHEVVIRNQLTKNRFKYEYFNTNKELKASISRNSLKMFDLMIIDEISYFNLSNKQYAIIENVVKNIGLGVFIQSDASLFYRKSNKIVFKFLPNQQRFFKLKNENSNFQKFAYRFKKDVLLEPIHADGEVIYSAYKLLNNGKIGSTVAQNTYQLALKGEIDAYQKFWTSILNTVSKKQMELSQFSSNEPFGFKDEPYYFKLRAAFDKPIATNLDKQVLPLRQDIEINTSWYGRTYPKTVGWEKLSIEQDSINAFSFYVIDTSKYTALRAYKTMLKNRRYFSNTEAKPSIFSSLKLIPAIWFYLLFLCCIAYLWLIPKLS